MIAAYIVIKKASGSVHCDVLCDFLRLGVIPAGIIGLLSDLYFRTESAVRYCGGVSSFLPVHTGVRQGCVLAPSLFKTCMDWVLGRVVDQSQCGRSGGTTKIIDLVLPTILESLLSRLMF